MVDSSKQTPFMRYIGVAIAKQSFDVAIPLEKGYQLKKYPYQTTGLAALPAASCCVLKATGPYYVRLATFLYEQGIAVAVVNPLVIKRFSQMRLLRTKTDQADVKLIAAYGALEKPALWQPAVAYITELQQESTVLEGLIKQRTALKNQLEAFNQLPQVRAHKPCRPCKLCCKPYRSRLRPWRRVWKARPSNMKRLPWIT